ncbi:guanylate kinase [Lactobacillus sp. PV034]|uniref:guanylate kinase n=1 Tax=Lactobacillus sp. PV034 TaxID=2594495 RepID=UPI0022409BF8|nr:AAA family ATPase [Lactobacillus sp. PV034]QNQ81286.1 guanylate kinase [Lactobacillus sp. PV034]
MQRIIIIAGPSGVGKTTVTNYLSQKYNIPRVITHTTRPMRKGEKDGESYYFETDTSFNKLHFFEHVKYGSYQYGSSREALNKAWKKSDLVTLIVDTDGVKSYLDELKEKAFFIYLTVSQPHILRQRLIGRGDNIEEINKRLDSKEFKRDLSLNPELNDKVHYLNNDDLNKTKEELDEIVKILKDSN